MISTEYLTIFAEEILKYGLNLYNSGCTGSKFRKDNRYFFSISDDSVYNVVLEINNNKLIDGHCDCNGDNHKFCEHICCSYIEYLNNSMDFEDFKVIQAKINSMSKNELKSLFEKSIMFYPSLIKKLNLKDEKTEIDSILSEIRLIINTVKRGETLRIDTINSIAGIFISEAMNYEHKKFYPEAGLIYITLMEELEKIITNYNLARKNITILPVLKRKYNQILKKTSKQSEMKEDYFINRLAG